MGKNQRALKVAPRQKEIQKRKPPDVETYVEMALGGDERDRNVVTRESACDKRILRDVGG